MGIEIGMVSRVTPGDKLNPLAIKGASIDRYGDRDGDGEQDGARSQTSSSIWKSKGSQ
jgi:hypothetical protein